MTGWRPLGSRSIVEELLASARVAKSSRLLQTLQSNAYLRPGELAEIGKKLAALEASPAAEPSAAAATDEAVESTVTNYLEQNAAELAADPDKPFHPIGMTREEGSGEAGEVVRQAPAEAGVAAGKPAEAAPGRPTASAVDAVAQAKKQPHPVHEERRESMLQKIAKLNVKGRIALAIRGDKEARSILIRDGTKLVALAVLTSPKVSEREVEGFAQQKNVLDSVLRAIPLNRRFLKNYAIVRNLVFNPRSPIDLSLGLVKRLLVQDLKNLMDNKEVPDTIRKAALRLHKQKMEMRAGRSGH